MKEKIKAVVILGPTSSGKSDLAVKIAKKFNGEIISADSRQIYKDMNLGTGKVEGSWQKKDSGQTFFYKKVPHHLIDFKSPRSNYNVSHFKKDAQKIILQISKRKKLPILCGGTGFWISALVYDIDFPKVKPDKKLRKKLEKLSCQKLLEKLKKADPQRAKEIDPKNKLRLIRALEICQSMGKVPRHQPKPHPQIDFLLLGIKVSKNELAKKIKLRLQKRLNNKMIKEVELLHRKWRLSWKKIQSFGLAYFWIPLFLQNKISSRELFERILMAERNYAKRQRTWFKKDKNIIWIENEKEAFKKVKNFIS